MIWCGHGVRASPGEQHFSPPAPRRGDRRCEVGTEALRGGDAPTRERHAFTADNGPTLNSHTAAASGKRASRPLCVRGGQIGTEFLGTPWFV